jgi:FixJ family two-component response regulator
MLISGYFYQDDPAIQAALEQKLIQGFVEKPFSHTEMIGVIGTALSSSAAQQPAGSGAAEPLAAG